MSNKKEPTYREKRIAIEKDRARGNLSPAAYDAAVAELDAEYPARRPDEAGAGERRGFLS